MVEGSSLSLQDAFNMCVPAPGPAPAAHGRNRLDSIPSGSPSLPLSETPHTLLPPEVFPGPNPGHIHLLCDFRAPHGLSEPQFPYQ